MRCDNCLIETKSGERGICTRCRENYPALARQDDAWVLLHRWENVAKNGGEKWLREHPLVAETTKLLNEEAAVAPLTRSP